MSKIFDLWNTVAGAFGPSGREDAVRETIAEIAGAYIDDVTTDALGNLICRKKGAKNGKKLLFAAHMDSIGVVATYIEDKGFIRFSQIGGLYVGDLLNIQVKFANGTRGVISYEEKTPLKDLTLDNLFIDIGAKNAEEARKLVQIGDFAVYEAPRFEQNGVLCGPYQMCIRDRRMRTAIPSSGKLLTRTAGQKLMSTDGCMMMPHAQPPA